MAEIDKAYIKVGAKVKAYVRDYNSWGETIRCELMAGTVVALPRDKYTGRFISRDRWRNFDKVTVDFGGDVRQVDWDELMPDVDLNELTREQSDSLFDQIAFGSIYIDDYSNDMLIYPKQVCDVADAYTDELYQEHGEDWYKYLSKDEWYERIKAA